METSETSTGSRSFRSFRDKSPLETFAFGPRVEPAPTVQVLAGDAELAITQRYAHVAALEEPPEPASVARIFVVWDDWASLSQQERSEIILNAYERAKGKQAALKITVAMGLTATEAKRMRIPAH